MSNPVLEKLINRKERLEARVKLLKNRTLSKERKDDTRRKILAGAYILHKCESDNTLSIFVEEIKRFLSRDSDKALFKLPFKSITPEASTVAKSHKETKICN